MVVSTQVPALTTQCVAWKTDVASKVRYAGLTPPLTRQAFGEGANFGT
jgi:hypothetical protein